MVRRKMRASREKPVKLRRYAPRRPVIGREPRREPVARPVRRRSRGLLGLTRPWYVAGAGGRRGSGRRRVPGGSARRSQPGPASPPPRPRAACPAWNAAARRRVVAARRPGIPSDEVAVGCVEAGARIRRSSSATAPASAGRCVRGHRAVVASAAMASITSTYPLTSPASAKMASDSPEPDRGARVVAVLHLGQGERVARPADHEVVADLAEHRQRLARRTGRPRRWCSRCQ